MKRTTLRVLPALLVAIILGMQSGCDSGKPSFDTQPVTGTVTYNGSPVENALVTFVPDSGSNSASGRTDASGQYSLNTTGVPGAPLGSYRVKIVKMQVVSGAPPVVMGQSEEDGDSYNPDAETAKPPADFKPLPPKFADVKTSGFTYTVIEGENKADFAMTD